MDQDTNIPLLDHLEELRFSILRIIIALVILVPLGYYLSHYAIQGLISLCPELSGEKFFFSHPFSLFFVRIKVGIVIAFLIGAPYIAYQVWTFISPGLFKHERYFIKIFVAASTLFFIIGAAFAVFAIFPMAVTFACSMQTDKLVYFPRIDYFINLASMLILGFGLVFQLPIVVFILVKSGIVEAKAIRHHRPIVIVVIFIISALFTPPDVISQLAMALPALFLFEGSLLLASWAKAK